MREPRKEYIIKQFRLPIEEALLNRVINDPNCIITDKQVMPDRNGDFVVYLEYEKFIDPDSSEEEDMFNTPIDFD